MVRRHTFSWCLIAVFVYAAGYFKGNDILSNLISIKRFLISALISSIAAVTVVITRYFCDGSILYDRIIIYYGLVFVDSMLFLVIYYLGNKLNKRIKTMDFVDGVSCEFYIVHGLIINMVTKIILEKCGSVILTIIIRFLVAFVLNKIVQ